MSAVPASAMAEWDSRTHLRRACELLENAEAQWTGGNDGVETPLGLMLANTHIEMAQAKRNIGALS